MIDVGAEYGFAATDDVCERPHAMYRALAYGERGENRRVDETLAMIDGTFRMPRFPATAPSMATVSYSSHLADGSALACTGLARGPAHDCLVPDWRRYYGTEISAYDRFVFYGLRMVSSLLYTAYYSRPERIHDRYQALTGKELDADGIAWVRTEARHLAIAIIDSFVADGHIPLALDRMPACYGGASGYQNPNSVWAPVLAQWDPSTRLDDGELHNATDVPADCTGVVPDTYFDLRGSLWNRHAAAFRAMALANSYFMFRGMLSDDRREAWLRVIRETGDALALPSSYEPEQNHGTTESAALIELGGDFAGRLPEDVTSAWMELGRYRLNDLLVDTVFADGFQIEQSPMYHTYVAVELLEILRWLDARGLDLVTDIDPDAPIDYDAVAPAPANPSVNMLNVSTTVDPRAIVDRMIRASVFIAEPDGVLPMIGTSGTQNLREYQKDVLEDYLDEQRTYASLFRYFKSGGTEGTPPPENERLSVFEDSGFVIMRSGFKPDFAKQTHVVFDTAAAYTGHGHPDTLSVHLFGPDTTPHAVTGTELLVDAGFYSGEDIGAHYFRSTQAHNTVNVDGANQCVRETAHMRLDPYKDGALPSCAELAAIRPGAGVAKRGRSIQGTWNGLTWSYQSAFHTLYLDTTHRRAVLLVGGNILVVVDMLASDAPHTFSQTWHLAPRIPRPTSVPAGAGGVYHVQFARSADDRAPLVSLHEATDGAELVLHHGDPPIAGIFGQGWHSTAEDQAEPDVVVELRRSGVTSTAFASVFLLGDRAGQQADVTLRRDGTWSGGITVRLEDGKSLSIELENLADASGESVRVY